jgi:hypothetical protein
MTPAPDSAPIDHDSQETITITRHLSGPKIPLNEINSYKPSGNVLRDALEWTRNRNRDAIIRKQFIGERQTGSQVRRPEHPDLTPQRREKLQASIYRARQDTELATKFPMAHLPHSLRKRVLVKMSNKDKHKYNKDKNKNKNNGNLVSSHPHALQQLNGSAVSWRGDKLEYLGKYVPPTFTTTIPATDFPWMKGQEETWGEAR